jgi:hypothetical protein
LCLLFGLFREFDDAMAATHSILCFPIPVIKTLRVDLKRKISILRIFWLGGFVCISAIVRFIVLYKTIYRLTDYGENQYSSITRAFIWAEIEPNTSVIAACLPTYGPLVKEGGLAPRILQWLRSTLGSSTESEPRGRRSATNNTTAAGYYELDHVVSHNKSGGDIVTERTATDLGSLASDSGLKIESKTATKRTLDVQEN